MFGNIPSKWSLLSNWISTNYVHASNLNVNKKVIQNTELSNLIFRLSLKIKTFFTACQMLRAMSQNVLSSNFATLTLLVHFRGKTCFRSASGKVPSGRFQAWLVEHIQIYWTRRSEPDYPRLSLKPWVGLILGGCITCRKILMGICDFSYYLFAYFENTYIEILQTTSEKKRRFWNYTFFSLSDI